jgi:hypothetical protein
MWLAMENCAANGPQLSELIAALDSVTPGNVETFSPLFCAFASNGGALRTFLSQVCDGDVALQKEANTYGRDALIVARGDNWVIRLAAWEPTLAAESLLHTHPFMLLTYGVVGPGYATEMYRVDREELSRRRVGERVALVGPMHMRLAHGRGFCYPAHALAHRQFAPERYSISLNLIVDARELPPHDQYFIDPGDHTLVRRS